MAPARPHYLLTCHQWAFLLIFPLRYNDNNVEFLRQSFTRSTSLSNPKMITSQYYTFSDYVKSFTIYSTSIWSYKK
jgi:hypothetical protein